MYEISRATHWKAHVYTLQKQTRLSLYTHKKSGVRPCIYGGGGGGGGVEHYKFECAKKSGSGDLHLYWGAIGGSDPARGVRPCNQGIVYTQYFKNKCV